MSAANFNSNSYDSGRITYTSDGTVRQSAAAASATRHHFLEFLRVVQRLQIDFLPLQRQPGLDRVGKGGTATVFPALVNVEKTYAFKQMRKTRWPEEESQAMSALIAEISILGRPEIKSHENIVVIRGVCWDVDIVEEKVWPVLVFEKALYGDLNNFMRFGIGKELSIEKRLSILAGVALALCDLHLAGWSLSLSFPFDKAQPERNHSWRYQT